MKEEKEINKFQIEEDQIEGVQETEEGPRQISRKEALKKTGFLALSAATMMLLLNKPDKAVASSPAPPPGGGW
jgi:hypothetical protein